MEIEKHRIVAILKEKESSETRNTKRDTSLELRVTKRPLFLSKPS